MIDLYYSPTSNGQRALLALEESGIEFRRHKLDLAKGEQKTPEFTALNPLQAVPVIRDDSGPGGKPLVLSQSVAIMLYVADKAGKLIPQDALRRAQMQQWLMLVASDIGMTSSAIFHLGVTAPEKSPANIAFFEKRLARYFAVCNAQLAGREYLADEFSLADLALYPNATARRSIIDSHGPMPNLVRWIERVSTRPAVARAMQG